MGLIAFSQKNSGWTNTEFVIVFVFFPFFGNSLHFFLAVPPVVPTEQKLLCTTYMTSYHVINIVIILEQVTGHVRDGMDPTNEILQHTHYFAAL